MRRKLLNLCSAASLLLCLSACGMWVRSQRWTDVLLHGRGDQSGLYGFSSRPSHLTFEVSWGMRPGSMTIGPAWRLRSEPSDPDAPWDGWVSGRVVRWRSAGFLWASHDPPREAYSMRLVVLPYWSLAVASAVLPACWLLRVRPGRRRARLAAGLCVACGYDLRGTPERCPECGTVPA